MAGVVPQIYAASIATYSIALLSLSFRVIALRLTKHRAWIDDYFCIIAFLLITGYGITIWIWTGSYRLGQTIDDLDAAQQDHVTLKSRQLLWISGLTYASSIAFAKLCILSFYWKLFKITSIRIPIIVLLVSTTLWIVLRTFLLIFQCLPIQYIWDKDIDGHCSFKASDFFFGSIFVHCLMDCIIVILPIFPVAKMQLDWKQKLGVIGLFASGTIVIIASVFVLVESVKYDPYSPNLPYQFGPNAYWAAVEVNMAIFSSCLPKLRPVFRMITGRQPNSTSDASVPQIEAVRLSAIRLPANFETEVKPKLPSRIKKIGFGRFGRRPGSAEAHLTA